MVKRTITLKSATPTRFKMITQCYTHKESRSKCAWLALTAAISCTDIEAVFSADMPIIPAPDTISTPALDIPAMPLDLIPPDNAIGAILLSKLNPLLLRSDFSRDSEVIQQIYQYSHFQPIWFSANRSEKNLQDLLSLLSNAPSDALNPANYDIDRLKDIISSQTSDNNATAGYDLALTVSLVRYLHDLRHGQVDPRDIQYPLLSAPKPALDVAGLLRQHLAAQNLSEITAQFEPKSQQYQRLKQILNRTKAELMQATPVEFKFNKELHPGERNPQLSQLRRRLQAIGLLDGKANVDNTLYDSALVSAVKKIQQQQGLQANGLIGSATAAVFTSYAQEKIAQIELAMERARWIPDTGEGPMIVVNIPAFELWAFNSANDAKPLNMKVVVGKYQDNQTPLLWEDMKYLEFMPYWNIPKSIFDKEIRPKAANNAGYLASKDIELIQHQNSEERGGGSYIRARQRPGKQNPLGRVKFVFPNTADVYLHDTPGRSAFNRSRRDLSHGCVRVANPEQLAAFVLVDQDGWDKESIKQAMSTPKTRHVTLKRAVPVLFYYATTFVDHENRLHFYPDVYGQDEQLKKALSKLQASPAAAKAGSSPNT